MTARLAPADMIERTDAADMIDHALAAEPIDPIEANEPMEPIDSTLPTEPIDRIELRLPMLRIDRSDFQDHRDDDALITPTLPSRAGRASVPSEHADDRSVHSSRCERSTSAVVTGRASLITAAQACSPDAAVERAFAARRGIRPGAELVGMIPALLIGGSLPPMSLLVGAAVTGALCGVAVWGVSLTRTPCVVATTYDSVLVLRCRRLQPLRPVELVRTGTAGQRIPGRPGRPSGDDRR